MDYTKLPPEALDHAVPDEVKALDCWAIWAAGSNGDDKLNKTSYTPARKKASCADASTHSSYAECFALYKENEKVAGLNIATGHAGPEGYVLAAFDLDDCIIDDEPVPRAEAVMHALDSYVEYSPSREGIRILCWVPEGTKGIGRKKDGFEFFCGKHFASVTGYSIGLAKPLAKISRSRPRQLYEEFAASSSEQRDYYAETDSDPEPRKTTKPAKDKTTSDEPFSSDDDERVTREAVERALRLLSDERADNYDSWIEVLCALQDASHRCGEDLSELWHFFSKRSGKYSSNKCQKRWDTFEYRYDDDERISVASLFHWASEDGGTFETVGSVSASDAEIHREAERIEQSPLLPFDPFPVEHLPEVMQDWTVQLAAAASIDPSFAAMPLISSVASAIGNSRVVHVKNTWKAPAVLWILTVGVSGTGKSIGFKAVTRMIHAKEQHLADTYANEFQKYEVEKLKYEAALNKWKRSKCGGEPPFKPAPPQQRSLSTNDPTIEAMVELLYLNPRGLLLARDEMSGWFGGFGKYSMGPRSSDLSKWLEMYDASTIGYDRKTGDHKHIRVSRAAVSVIGGIQPNIVKSAFVGELIDCGFSARFLLAYPPHRETKWTDKDVSPSSTAKVESMLDRLWELQPEYDHRDRPIPIELRMSPEARSAYTAYYDIRSEKMKHLTGVARALWTKLNESAIRLALVVHLARWAEGSKVDPEVISLDSMKSGIALAQWFGNEGHRIYRLFYGSSFMDKEAAEVAHLVRSKGGTITVRELMQAMKKYRSDSDTAERVLAALVQAGIGVWNVEQPSKRGRPRRVFTLLKR